MYDLIVRGGLVVDGTGGPPRTADVAVADGTIIDVGRVDGATRREIAADGLLVTPGFVDIHTHYDGQITWDPLLTPSCWHGVTTVVMGNCGVGFAPVEPARRDWLIGLMEGVEDIPGAALSAGIEWAWESFPEYLDRLDSLPMAIDVGTQVPHGAVRAYVMGERGARNEPATAEDIGAMASIVKEGLVAGALGFSTSRTIMHTAIDGEPVPGTFAAEDELFGLGSALAEVGAGVYELAPAGALGEDLDAPDREMAWILRLAAAIGRPVSFALSQNNEDPEAWRRLLGLAADAYGAGRPVRPQVHARTVSLLLGLSTFHPFNFAPSWAEIGLLAPDAQAGRLSGDDHLRDRLVREVHDLMDDPVINGFMHPDRVFRLGDPPDYEPPPESSLGAVAAVEGRDPWASMLDALAADGGRELLNSPILNYSDGNLDAAHEMLTAPCSIFGLGDGGAHAGQTCDASSTTFLLSHWARDRRGRKLTIEQAVHKMTGATAALYGLGDRGIIEPGRRGDLNLIDFERLQLHRPELAHDLPGGAKRLVQRSTGYVATINAGTVIQANGEDTGERPGRLIRGCR